MRFVKKAILRFIEPLFSRQYSYLAKLYKNTSEGIVIISDSYEVIDSNPAAQEILGFTTTGIPKDGLRKSKYYSETGKEISLEEVFSDSIKNKTVKRDMILGILYFEMDRIIWLSGDVIPIKRDGVKQLICTFSDISEHKLRFDLLDMQNNINRLLINIEGSAEVAYSALEFCLTISAFDSIAIFNVNDISKKLDIGISLGVEEEISSQFSKIKPDVDFVIKYGKNQSKDIQFDDDVKKIKSCFKKQGYQSLHIANFYGKENIDGLIILASKKSNKTISKTTTKAIDSIASVLSDVMMRRVAEKRLKQNEAHLRHFFDTGELGMSLLSSDFVLLNMNSKMEEITGLKASSAILKNLEEVDYINSVGRKEDYAVMQSGRSDKLFGERTIYRPDGSHCICNRYSQCFRNAKGDIEHYMFVLQDITESKKLQLDLEDAKKAAEAASFSKSDFVAKISHEIRTPLTSMRGYLDFLSDPNITEDEHSEYLQTVKRNSDTILNLTNDILDLSKVESGKLIIEKEECNPKSLLVDVVSLVKVRALEKKIYLTYEIDKQVPDTIVTDSSRLRQILVNLIGNAVKFTHEGGVHVTLINDPDESSKSSSPLLFKIQDTGVGIAEDSIEKLFKPYYQVKQVKVDKIQGTGLGLTIAQNLANKLGGEIKIQSKFGEGSTFILSIDTNLDQLSQVEHHDQTVKLGKSISSIFDSLPTLVGKVLIADDNEDIQNLLKVLLKKTGLEVEVADNGQIAYDKVMASVKEGLSYDLILMDMQMPELNGFEATRLLRSNGWTKPIIALTASAMMGAKENCMEAGCGDDYAEKLMDYGTLIEKITMHLGQCA